MSCRSAVCNYDRDVRLDAVQWSPFPLSAVAGRPAAAFWAGDVLPTTVAMLGFDAVAPLIAGF